VEIVIASRSPLKGGAGLGVEQVDLLAPGAAKALIDRVTPTHLIHLAWEARPGRFWTAPENLDWCAASLTLLRAFAEAGGRRAVATGSCAEYAWEDEVLTENETPRRPNTLYGTAKNGLYELASAWAAQTGLSFAWGRVFWLYGPGEPSGRLVPDVISALLDGRLAETTAGLQQRDFLHVADVADAIAVALYSDYRGAFNIGSGDPVPVRDIATRLATLAGREDLLRIGAKPAHAPEPPKLVASTTILNRDIGFTPRISLADGLADTLAWRRRQICEPPSDHHGPL
jgi:nucleoside-diphosphate-sugar epimerase